MAKLTNWPVVLSKIALSDLGWGGPVLLFKTRSGLRVSSLNTRSARCPLFEVLVDDVYHLGSLDTRTRPLAVLDVGAHVGALTLALAAKLPSARFTCYEPATETARWLASNVEANCMSSRVRVEVAAVGLTDGSGVLYRRGDLSCEATLIEQAGASEERVRVVSLETALETADGADLVKLDCEGAEYDIILSSPDHCWAQVRDVILEYHPHPVYGFAELSNRLTALGFEQKWHDRRPRDPFLGMAWFTRPPLRSGTLALSVV